MRDHKFEMGENDVGKELNCSRASCMFVIANNKCALIKVHSRGFGAEQLRMVSLLHTILMFFLFGLVAHCYSREGGQEYKEELLLRHLPDEKILANFQLTTSWRIHPLLLTHSHSGPIRGM